MTTRTVKLDTGTIGKLDKIGKEMEKDHGIINPSYTQIIEYVLNKLEKK